MKCRRMFGVEVGEPIAQFASTQISSSDPHSSFCSEAFTRYLHYDPLSYRCIFLIYLVSHLHLNSPPPYYIFIPFSPAGYEVNGIVLMYTKPEGWLLISHNIYPHPTKHGSYMQLSVLIKCNILSVLTIIIGSPPLRRDFRGGNKPSKYS